MAGAGVLWALALLTKIHAWFLLPILGHGRSSGCRPDAALAAMLAWTVVGISLFWLGWPWLWYDSWNRLQAYLGDGRRAVDDHGPVLRPGRRRSRRALALPLVLFRRHDSRSACWPSAPSGSYVAGANRRADPFPLLLAGTIVVFLVIFSTRVPVYDGERLFLHVFPAWALLVGLGFGWLWEHRLTSRSRPCRAGGLPVRSVSMASSRCTRSGSVTTMGLVGGLPGAERLGLELTYWNDPVDQVLLDRLAREAHAGASAALVPTLYPGQGILTTNRALGTARRHPERRTRGQPGPSGWSCRAAPRTGALEIKERLRRGRWSSGGRPYQARSLASRRCGISLRAARQQAGQAPRDDSRNSAAQCQIRKVRMPRPFARQDLRNFAPSL